MSTNFDDILKKGKQSANAINPREEWRECVVNVMFELHNLNEMYKDTHTHHISVEQQKCDSCGEATFVLVVRDWDDRGMALKFHKGSWTAIDEDTYRCDRCPA